MSLNVIFQRALVGVGAVLLPSAILGAGLAISRGGTITPFVGWMTLAVSILVGVIGIWKMPVRWYWRLIVAVASVAVTSPTLGFCMLAFACSAYRQCP